MIDLMNAIQPKIWGMMHNFVETFPELTKEEARIVFPTKKMTVVIQIQDTTSFSYNNYILSILRISIPSGC